MLMKLILVITLLTITNAVQQAPWSCKKNGKNERYMLVVGEYVDV